MALIRWIVRTVRPVLCDVMQIRSFERQDYESWLPLWQENCLHQISDVVTTETWRRLCHKKEPVFGLGVYDENQMQGFLHYILHPTTGFIEQACYMQDIFIAPDYRKQGLAKRLLWELDEKRRKENWSRLYWFAEKDNMAAQKLYENIGVSLNFSLHMIKD